MRAICKVCQLIDKDETTKEVHFCVQCNEWICEECRPNMLKRAKAALVKLIKNMN